MLQNSSYFLKIIYLFIYLFAYFLTYLLERGVGKRKRVRETLMCDGLPLTGPQLGTWPATQAGALTGNR